MSKLSKLLANIKHYNNELFQNIEKITIIDKSRIYIQNYNEIEEIQDKFIKLSKILIIGEDLKVISISKYFLEITGKISDIKLGAMNND